MDRNILLGKLPVFNNSSLLIESNQSVHDIVKEVIDAHNDFKTDYDFIAEDFLRENVIETCKALWTFLKYNVRYVVEGEDYQTTKSPSAIIATGKGDCKHFAGFIGGVLDAIMRNFNVKIDWNYRFASYNSGMALEHVFIVVKNNGKEYWIDPVLKDFNERLQPTYFINKRTNNMALMRLSGMNDVFSDQQPGTYPISVLLENTEPSSQMYAAIQLLLKYGIMDAYARVNDWVFAEYKNDTMLYNRLVSARQTVEGAAIGGLFKTILRGVKKVIFLAPRNAYLGLVGINAFGYATKLKAAIYNPDGSYTSFKDKLYDLWSNKFGGDWTALINTINAGAKKRAILGQAAAAPAAWVLTASAIIAAMSPIIVAALKSKQNQYPLSSNPNIDPTTGLSYGNPNLNVGTGSGISNSILNNPVLLIGGAVAIYFLIKKRKT
jgi:hypothetical protein